MECVRCEISQDAECVLLMIRESLVRALALDDEMRDQVILQVIAQITELEQRRR